MLDSQTKRDLNALAEESLYVYRVLQREFKEKHPPMPPGHCELVVSELAAGIMAGRSVKQPERKNVD